MSTQLQINYQIFYSQSKSTTPNNALKYLNKAFELSGNDHYKERIEALNKK
jgi:hypothetical protein